MNKCSTLPQTGASRSVFPSRMRILPCLMPRCEPGLGLSSAAAGFLGILAEPGRHAHLFFADNQRLVCPIGGRNAKNNSEKTFSRGHLVQEGHVKLRKLKSVRPLRQLSLDERIESFFVSGRERRAEEARINLLRGQVSRWKRTMNP